MIDTKMEKRTGTQRLLNLDKLAIQRRNSTFGQVLPQHLERKVRLEFLRSHSHPAHHNLSHALVAFREFHDFSLVLRDDRLVRRCIGLDEGTFPADGMGSMVLLVGDN